MPISVALLKSVLRNEFCNSRKERGFDGEMAVNLFDTALKINIYVGTKIIENDGVVDPQYFQRSLQNHDLEQNYDSGMIVVKNVVVMYVKRFFPYRLSFLSKDEVL